MKLNSIQFLRAVAALLVVYEHSMDVQIRYGISAQQKFYHLDNFGCIGVDLFFVISGFIITYVAKNYKGLEQSKQFLVKRFYRINPTYYITTLIFLVSILLQLLSNNQSILNSLTQIIGSLCDSILIIPIVGDVDSFSPLLLVGWTLSYEWLFYLIFILLILTKTKHKALYLFGIIGFLIIIGQIIKFEDFRLIFLTNPIMLEFLLGVIICYIYLKVERIPTYIGAGLLFIGLLSYILMIRYGFGNVWHYLGVLDGTFSLNRFFLWGIPSSFIVAGCVILEKNNRLSFLWNNGFVLLGGDASYSIYLVHYTVFSLFILLYKKIGLFLPADAIIWLQLIVAVIAAIGFYKFVEKPLLKYLQNRTIWNARIETNGSKASDLNKQIKTLIS